MKNKTVLAILGVLAGLALLVLIVAGLIFGKNVFSSIKLPSVNTTSNGAAEEIVSAAKTQAAEMQKVATATKLQSEQDYSGTATMSAAQNEATQIVENALNPVTATPKPSATPSPTATLPPTTVPTEVPTPTWTPMPTLPPAPAPTQPPAPVAPAAVAPIAPVIPPTDTTNITFTVVELGTVGNWTLQWTAASLKDRGDGKSFYQFAHETWPNWKNLEPDKWATTPDVPNPLIPDYKTADGLEIPQGEANYCQVLQGELCTNPVAAGEQVHYTGDGYIPGVWKSTDGAGNSLSIWNVGNVTARFDGAFYQGWRNHGRYFNGDKLNVAIYALHSFLANVMLNLKSELNPGDGLPNAGANCSVRPGCDSVVHTIVITSGNEILLIATTTTYR